MERASEGQVVADWLAVERTRDHAERSISVAELSPEERRRHLQDLNEAATWVFGQKVWYKTQSTAGLLRSAKHIWSSVGIPEASVVE